MAADPKRVRQLCGRDWIRDALEALTATRSHSGLVSHGEDLAVGELRGGAPTVEDGDSRDPDFNAIFRNWNAFRMSIQEWSGLSEAAMTNYQSVL